MDAAERSVSRYGRLCKKTLMDQQLISGELGNDQSDARASKLMVSVLNHTIFHYQENCIEEISECNPL